MSGRWIGSLRMSDCPAADEVQESVEAVVSPKPNFWINDLRLWKKLSGVVSKCGISA